MTPSSAAIYRASDEYHNALEAGDRQALGRLKTAYQSAWSSLQDALDTLEVARRRKKNHPDNSVYGKYVEERLAELVRQIGQKLGGFADLATHETTARQQEGVRVAGDQVRQLTLLSVPERQRGVVGAQWVRVPDVALRSLVGFLADDFPLDKVLGRLAGEGAARCAQVLQSALVQGLNPRRTARTLEDEFKVAPAKALLICRTESLRSHREACHRHVDANRKDKGGPITGWMWKAALDRSCAACIAMNGTFHEADERLQDHPCGRCQMIPLTDSSAAVMVEAASGQAEAFLQGKEPVSLRSVFGSRRAAAAFTSGEVSLTDFVGYRESPEWGRSIYRKSISQIMREKEHPPPP